MLASCKHAKYVLPGQSFGVLCNGEFGIGWTREGEELASGGRRGCRDSEMRERKDKMELGRWSDAIKNGDEWGWVERGRLQTRITSYCLKFRILVKRQGSIGIVTALRYTTNIQKLSRM